MNDMNPYATSVASGAGTVAASRRSASVADLFLIVPLTGGSLPQHCVVCHAASQEKAIVLQIPTMSYRVMRTVFVLSFLLTGPFFWFFWCFLACIDRVKIVAFLCRVHHRREVIAQTVFKTLLLSALALIVGGFETLPLFGASFWAALMVMCGLLGLLVAFGYQVFRSKPLMPIKVNKEVVWLRGAHPDFVAEFATLAPTE